MKKSGIYKIQNVISGRVYVGSALNIKARWSAHIHRLKLGNHHSKVFQRSWNKHGQECFEFSILEIVLERENLIDREQYWLDILNAACPHRGLNRQPIAGSALGTKASAETKAKLSAIRKGRPKSAEHRRKIGDGNRGKIVSQKTRDLISKINSGKRRSDETRAKMSASHKGIPISRECIERLREFNTGRPKTAEHCAAISAARKGKPLSEKQSAHWAKVNAAQKGKPKTPEHNAKVSIALKKFHRKRRLIASMTLHDQPS